MEPFLRPTGTASFGHRERGGSSDSQPFGSPDKSPIQPPTVPDRRRGASSPPRVGGIAPDTGRKHLQTAFPDHTPQPRMAATAPEAQDSGQPNYSANPPSEPAKQAPTAKSTDQEPTADPVSATHSTPDTSDLDDHINAALAAPEDPPEPPEARYSKFHPIGRYIGQRKYSTLEKGETVRIPTGLTERTTYTKTESPWVWVTNRSASEYRRDLFQDEYGPVASDSHPLAGGEKEAFAPGKAVLDVRSGEAIAVLEFAKMYPLTTIIGIDKDYREERTIDTTKPGVQLTKDDWHTFHTIPDGSIDTILADRTVFPWGIVAENPQSSKIADSLTRIAKERAVFRFDISPDHITYREYIRGMLEERGWEVIEPESDLEMLLDNMVAIKRGQKNNMNT